MKFAQLVPWRRKAAAEQGQDLDGTLKLLQLLAGSRQSKSGQAVDWKTALRCSTALACVRVLSNGLAQVPLKLYREAADGKKEAARDHPLYDVLHRRPNEWQTSYEFRETLALHLTLCGRAYAFKNISRGEIRELIPLDPSRVTPLLQSDGHTLRYRVTGTNGVSEEFDAGLIWHLKGPSWNGWQGLDALDLAREAVGLAIATEEQHADLHRNGIRPSGVYSVDGTLNPEQHKQLRKFLADNYAGMNSGLPMVLDRNAKWLSMTLSGVDAQHLETRNFQVEEVCRAMGVMPILVFHADKATTYASAEAMFQAHVVHTLAPWWARIEQSIDCNLLTRDDARQGLYAKFVGSGLLRGSTKDRAEYFAKALGSGGSPAWMTQDEVRSLEELNPMGGPAGELPIPTNVAPAKPSADPVPTGA